MNADGARVGQLRHLGQPLAALADGDRRGEARRDARLRAGALAQGAQHRRGVHHRLGVRHREDRAVAAGRGRARAGVDVLLVLAPGRAQVHVGVDEGGEGVQPLGLHDLGAVGRLERSGRADLGDRSRRARAGRPGRRAPRAGRAACAPRISSVAGPAVGTIEPGIDEVAHAGWGSVVRHPATREAGAVPGVGGPGRTAREQLVEDRHPHHHAGLHLLGDQRLGRVDHLGGQLDPAVDRAGVHQQLVRAQPAAVDLVAARRTRAARARRSPVIRSCCIRSA